MQMEITWRLPTFVPSELHPRHSWDGQQYYMCGACGVESRFDPIYFPTTPTFCPICDKKNRMSSVVHASELQVKCNDFALVESRLSAEFEEIRCNACMSTNLLIVKSRVTPPFPATFGDAIHRFTWGQDANADLSRIEEELTAGASYMLDFPGLLIGFVRFLDRLEKYSYSKNQREKCRILNFRANLLREYFRRTFVVRAGIDALKLFEQASRLTTETLERALIVHNVAMAAYSLLAKLPDDVVDHLAGDICVREIGLAAANEALVGYSNASNFASRDRDMGRVHHLIGDLLSAGSDLGEESKIEAIAHYETALTFLRSEPSFRTNIQVSLVNTISKLSAPTPDQKAIAIKILMETLDTPETGRNWPQQHFPRFMFGSYYDEQGQYKEAARQFEIAAELVLNDVANAVDEMSLHARITEYVPIFSGLTRAYARLNRPVDALASMEAIRAATIRLHTMSDKSRAERAEKQARFIASRLFGNSHTPKLRVDSPSETLKALRKALPNVSFVGLDFLHGEVTVVFDAPGRLFGRAALVETWEVSRSNDRDFFKVLRDFTMKDCVPSAFREQKIQKFYRFMHSRLFGPLHERLEKLGITDAIVMLPGSLHGLAADLNADNASAPIAPSGLNIRYVPSLAVAADLVRERRVGNGRLLIIGYGDEDLPSVTHEVNAIKEKWGENIDILHGRGLSKRDVLRALENEYQFVHFCCHGSYDLLFPEKSALHLTKNGENDAARITAADIRRLKLHGTAMISLSACSSGVASPDPGNDLFGLTGSLLRSGVQSIVGSRWPVYDAFAARFMAELYGALKVSRHDPFRAFQDTRAKFSKIEKAENWAAFGYTGV